MNRASITARQPRQPRQARQRGAALLVLMMILGLLAAYFAINALNRSSQNERNRLAATTLAQAKEALIGFAATYRDTHANQVFGYLPCPDSTNNGQAAAACGSALPTPTSEPGRLPWNTLGLPALRDTAGECLWYAVSGSAKDNPRAATAVFNWDTLGQYIVQDFGGSVLAGGLTGAAAHQRPLAVILAPGVAVGAQDRTAAGASECGGNLTQGNYLEATPASGTGTLTITLATPDTINLGTNNDQALWISSKEIFERVTTRSDFKTDIDTMVNEYTNCLNNLATIPAESPGSNKGFTTALTAINADLTCAAVGTQINVRRNWQDNLLYAHPATQSKVAIAGVTYSNCDAVLFFGGERTASQTRVTPAERGDATNFGDKTMYLEGGNATNFPNASPPGAPYTGVTGFNKSTSTADIVRCIKPPVGTQVSFSNPVDFASFVSAGAGVSTDISVPSTPKVIIAAAGGAAGGCFWYPNSIPLTGKVLRVFYNSLFSFADPVGGADRGNGFAFQLVRSDLGAPSATCGTDTNMGVLDISDMRGLISYIVETDVHLDAGNNDPAGNHTAIMLGGNLTHSATNGNPTTNCDGSAAGCRHSPVNKFEESPLITHSQRIEIHTGCDAGCANCDIKAPLAPNNTRVSVWVDCTSCNDVLYDFDRVAQAPTINRCIAVNPAMSSIYFGFTGGFRSGGLQQGVTLWNLNLRSSE